MGPHQRIGMNEAGLTKERGLFTNPLPGGGWGGGGVCLFESVISNNQFRGLVATVSYVHTHIPPTPAINP